MMISKHNSGGGHGGGGHGRGGHGGGMNNHNNNDKGYHRGVNGCTINHIGLLHLTYLLLNPLIITCLLDM